MKEGKTRAQAAGVLLKAAAYIRQYGWQEEGMGEQDGPRCSMGAIDSACPRGEWDDQVAKLMYSGLNKELDGLSLTGFNHKFQSGEKVARLYERTARSLING